MFFLDVDPKIAASRIKNNRTDFEMFENLSSLSKVRAKALELTRFDNWIIVDSNQPTEIAALSLRINLLS